MVQTFDASKYIVDEVTNFTFTIKEDSLYKSDTKIKSKWKRVTKDEFYAFINAYPTNLDFDTTGICDPPLSSYNDFTRGTWPDSMVAKVYRNDMLPKEWNAGENEYFLLRELYL